MRYFVIAKRWDGNKAQQVKYIAGEFDNYMNATIFKESYNNYYRTNATIVDDFVLTNYTLK